MSVLVECPEPIMLPLALFFCTGFLLCFVYSVVCLNTNIENKCSHFNMLSFGLYCLSIQRKKKQSINQTRVNFSSIKKRQESSGNHGPSDFFCMVRELSPKCGCFYGFYKSAEGKVNKDSYPVSRTSRKKISATGGRRLILRLTSVTSIHYFTAYTR